MEPPQKLKRGLKDISPLFGKPEFLVEDRPNLPDGKTQCLSVYSANLPGDSLLLSTFLASKLAQPVMPCFILTLQTDPHEGGQASRSSFLSQGESYGDYLKRLTLVWEEFDQMCHSGNLKGPVPEGRRESTETLFLEFDHSDLHLFRKLVPLLDKYVLMIQPSLESMTECYRMVKSLLCFNPDLEFYLLFEGSSSDPRGEILFERFSSMVSRRFGTSTSWFGNLDWLRADQPLHFNLNFQLLLSTAAPRYSLEKRRVGESLRKRFHL